MSTLVGQISGPISCRPSSGTSGPLPNRRPSQPFQDGASDRYGGLPDHYAETLCQFIAHLDSLEHVEPAKQLHQLKIIFSEAAAAHGLKHFMYHLIRSSGFSSSAGLEPCVISTYPEAWFRHYLAKGYMNDDPVVSEVLRRRLPFIWSEIMAPHDLSRRQQQFFEEARDAGLSDGMTLPIHNREGEVAAVSLIPEATGAEASMLMRRNQHVLYLMALHYHTYARKVLLKASLTGGSSRRRSLLSPREKEVLEWTAKGKSSLEIASILNLSRKSIEFHIEGSKRKLGVYNRAHAVAKALMLGLLSLD